MTAGECSDSACSISLDLHGMIDTSVQAFGQLVEPILSRNMGFWLWLGSLGDRSCLLPLDSLVSRFFSFARAGAYAPP